MRVSIQLHRDGRLRQGVLEAEDETSLAAFSLATAMQGNVLSRSLRAYTASEMDMILSKLPYEAACSGALDFRAHGSARTRTAWVVLEPRGQFGHLNPGRESVRARLVQVPDLR